MKFDIYFPPYSILQFVAMRDASPATLKIVSDFRRAAPRLTQLPKCACTIFAAIKEMTHDLGNYGDVVHHSPAVDLKVLGMAGEAKKRRSTAQHRLHRGTVQGAGRSVYFSLTNYSATARRRCRPGSG